MDGIRAYWNGQRLLSRHGKEINVPEEFLQGLPSNMALDGELWMGSGTLEKLMSILNSTEGDWSKIKYYVFDLPHSKGEHEGRMNQLKQLHFPQQVTMCKEKHLFCRLVLCHIQFARGITICWPS